MSAGLVGLCALCASAESPVLWESGNEELSCVVPLIFKKFLFYLTKKFTNISQGYLCGCLWVVSLLLLVCVWG